MDEREFIEHARKERRKEVRTGIGVMLLGLLVVAACIFLFVVEGFEPMMLFALAFGLTCLTAGPLIIVGQDHPASLWLALIGALGFTVTGVFMIASAIVNPAGSVGRYPTLGLAIAGLLAVGFFGPGTFVLARRIVRRRNGRGKDNGYGQLPPRR